MDTKPSLSQPHDLILEALIPGYLLFHKVGMIPFCIIIGLIILAIYCHCPCYLPLLSLLFVIWPPRLIIIIRPQRLIVIFGLSASSLSGLCASSFLALAPPFSAFAPQLSASAPPLSASAPLRLTSPAVLSILLQSFSSLFMESTIPPYCFNH